MRVPRAALCVSLVLSFGCTVTRVVEPLSDGAALDGGATFVDAPALDAGRPASDAGPRRDAPVADSGATGGCPEGDLGSMVARPVATGTTAGSSVTFLAACASGEPSPARRYRWVAPRAGRFGIDTFGSSFDTALVVLAASCAGAEVGCSDDAGFDAQSQVVVTATAGEAFVVVVAGYDGSESGPFVLNISEATETSEFGLCRNGLDDDLDGQPDCDDDDCYDGPECTELDCMNGVDDDGDGDTDCFDFDCDAAAGCTELDCMNGLDDNGDGDTDCADDDCDGLPGCIELDCDNGMDDEGDGFADCADRDCVRDLACIERVCTDTLDDELDGLTDCEDDDCDFDVACAGREHCFNGIDDDLDTLYDCDDPDCFAHPYCTFVFP